VADEASCCTLVVAMKREVGLKQGVEEVVAQERPLCLKKAREASTLERVPTRGVEVVEAPW